MSTEEGVDDPAAQVTAVLPTTVGLHGTAGAFDASEEEWSEYAEWLVHYFVANRIEAEERRRAILLTVVGPGTYRLLKSSRSRKLEVGRIHVRGTREAGSDSLQP